MGEWGLIFWGVAPGTRAVWVSRWRKIAGGLGWL